MSHHPSLDLVEKYADELAGLGSANEKLGKLSDRTVEIMREIGVIRMLQPLKYGGMESTPEEFAQVCMRLGALDGATGWVAGVVGVHPWEMACADDEVQQEIWGEDPDVWIASPYAPQGTLMPVEGGYRFSGRWQFSSGTDHCQWLFLGAMMLDDRGELIQPPEVYHVIIPRSDYAIVEDTWDVVGLRGTGSKDIVVDDAFVPVNRLISHPGMLDGSAPREAGLTNPIYHVPYSASFPLGITASVVGMAEGALALFLEQQRTRVRVGGQRSVEDPHVLNAIGEASAEISASRAALLENARCMLDVATDGEFPDFAMRANGRRVQVRAAWRAVAALDQLVARAGGNAMRMDNPIQRFWRDAHMGLTHMIHVSGNIMQSSAMADLGLDVPPGPLRSMI